MALAFSPWLSGATELLPLLSSAKDLEASSNRQDEIIIKTTGTDPQMAFEAKDRIAKDEHVLAFEYFCPDGVNFLEVFFKQDDESWSGQRRIEGAAMPKAEAWQPYAINLKTIANDKWTPKSSTFRLDFGNEPGVQLRIREVQLRRPTPEELAGVEAAERIRAAKLEQAKTIEEYLYGEYPWGDITDVTVGNDIITISGNIAANVDTPRYLIEYEPHENPWEPDSGTVLETYPLDKDFELTLPRFHEERDRLANRWALVAVRNGKNHRFSTAHWANNLVQAAERDMPRLRPANKKGLGGITYKADIFTEDMVDLDITAGTVNLKISDLFLPHREGDGIDFEHQGRIWNFNARPVHTWDKIIKELTDLNIVVSGILLIAKNDSPLLHPEYKPAGIFSIANLTTVESSDAYRAVIAFLAERYSRPDKRYGWISHWIIFNEVDYGWVWTNMGEQPLQVYLDAYHKAMRLTYLEARRYNPSAEVFISLTHNWNYDPADNFRTYAPRELLDRLAHYSATEGDFQWGVAYHPYPQSLLKPRTWEDNKAEASYDTKYITPKNIEVLDSYLHQPAFLYQGEPRTVLLSEQGFHTPDYSERSMLDKAAAIAYTWEKIMQLDTIESFHYHRWVDHPMEGGLKVGLRTLPEPGKPHGERKEPAFTVLADLETDQAEATIEPLKDIIGIRRWKEVYIDPDEIKTN